MLAIVPCEPTTNTMTHAKISTMIVRMAVATVESVLRMPHFARMDVRPANSAEPTAYNNHIQIASFSTIVRALPVLCNLLLYKSRFYAKSRTPVSARGAASYLFAQFMRQHRQKNRGDQHGQCGHDQQRVDRAAQRAVVFLLYCRRSRSLATTWAEGSPPCAASGPVWAYRLLIPDLRGDGAFAAGLPARD